MLPQVRGGEARYDSEGNLMKYTWRVTPEKSADAFCCGVPNRDFALLVLCYTILYGVDASIFIGLVEANSATSGFQVLWGFFWRVLPLGVWNRLRLREAVPGASSVVRAQTAFRNEVSSLT